MKVYLVISDKTPVMMFSSLRAAEQLCALRPDLHVHEFDVPDDLGPNVKVQVAGRDGFVTQQFLEIARKLMANAAENPDLPSTALMRMEEGQCQQERCPGMMAYGLLHLK